MVAEDAIRTTVDELLKALSANNIIGEPIETEDKILIPITKMGMGFGTGRNQGTEERDKGEISGAAGGGVGVFPVAVVVIFKGIKGSEGVKVMPLTAPSPLAESMVHVANTLMERLTNRKEGGEKKPAHTATIEVE
jgi:uncharacterized spore protein YtfJ